jgi:VCBS repeat protein/centrosomal CEP192-like protein/ASPM-SPD-2-Hydin domain-containing protein
VVVTFRCGLRLRGDPLKSLGRICDVVLHTVVPLLTFCIVASAQFERRTGVILSEPGGLAVGDFNRDGKLDIAVIPIFGVRNQVSILLGNGSGTFSTPVAYAVEAPHWIAVADFNGDGKLDLAIANSGVSVLLGNGDGTFQPAVNFSTPESTSFVGVGDFNNDGKADLVTLDPDGLGSCPCTSVFLGNGDGSFQPAVNEPIPFPVQSAIALGDFNRDGKLDLAVTGQFGFGSVLGILLGNGDGTFSAGASYSVGADPIAMIAADFNGDKKLDLAVANFQGQSVSVLLGNGDGTFEPAADYPTFAPYFIAAADLSGGGKIDLAVANLDSNGNLSNGSVSVLLGNGDGTFQAETTYPTGKLARSVTIGDFNGDHQLDLVVADSLSQDVTLLLNTGVVSFSPTTPLHFPTQLVGTISAPQSVTLTNSGGTPLSIYSMNVKGSQFQLSGATTCGATVAPGGSCAIRARFRPQSKGPKSGLLLVSDSASSKPQVIELSGNGTVVQLSTQQVTFPNTKVGTKSAPISVTLTNTGSTALNFTDISITGPDFSETNTCGSQIGAGATCQLSLVFAPTNPGLRSATLHLVDDGGGSPQTIALSGTGT